MDAELRDALHQVTTDLRVEIDQRAGELHAEIRAETREALERVADELRAEIRSAVVEMRRHFDVVGESLRGDIRGIAEGMALLSQRTDARVDQQGERTDRLEGRVLRLEVRVSSLEENRRRNRPRRRR